MLKKSKSVTPEYEGITSFQKGQAARLFRYLRLKNQGIDICSAEGGEEE